MHQAFAERRVDKVHPRREFFSPTPDQVLDVPRRHVGEVLSYTAEPEAEEYLISIGKKDASL
ncbi:GIY-YIG nuclease family protein [Rhodococcus sp. 14C212]|nr:GIY-YIG nuclease family protein [Rhodococcus sp. 14C212]